MSVAVACARGVEPLAGPYATARVRHKHHHHHHFEFSLFFFSLAAKTSTPAPVQGSSAFRARRAWRSRNRKYGVPFPGGPSVHSSGRAHGLSARPPLDFSLVARTLEFNDSKDIRHHGDKTTN